MSEVDHPAHYGGEDNAFETIKVLRAWNLEGAKWFCWGSMIKYLSRAEKKGGLKDYEKADWYATELVAIEAELALRPKKAPSDIPLIINGHGKYKLHIDYENRTHRLDYMGGGGTGGQSVVHGGGAGGGAHYHPGDTVQVSPGVTYGVGGAGGGTSEVKRCASYFGCKGGYHDRRCPLHIPRSGNG